jgi:hypothetical protein
MGHGTPEQQHQSNRELVDDLAAHVSAFDIAITQADPSKATVDELLQLDASSGSWRWSWTRSWCTST